MSSVKKNFFYQSIYEVLIIILPLLTSPYIARVLGAEKIGIYSYTYSVAYYFMLIAMLGIKNYGNRAIATVRDDQDALNREFSNIFALHAVLSTIAIAAYIIYCFVFVQENRIYAFIQIFWVIGALFDINWFFFGIEKFKLTVTRNTVIKLITVASIFIFVHGKEDLWKYVFIMAAGNFISQSVVWVFLRNYVQFIKPSIEEMRKHFKPMVVLFIPVLAVSLYKYMDKIMLGAMCEKAPCYVHLVMVFIAALRALPFQIVINDNFSIKTADMTVIGFCIKLGILNIIVNEFYQFFQSFQVMTHVWNLHVGNSAASRNLLELAFKLKLAESIDFFTDIYMIRVCIVSLISYIFNNTETFHIDSCKTIAERFSRCSIKTEMNTCLFFPAVCC